MYALVLCVQEVLSMLYSDSLYENGQEIVDTQLLTLKEHVFLLHPIFTQHSCSAAPALTFLLD